MASFIEYLKQEKVYELPHSPYWPDLAPCDFFPISEAQKNLAGREKNLGSV
jgi:histone-lysine N-methyltransferase SETMAR